MRTNYKRSLAFASAIVGSLCWIIGDMAVAGFEVDPNDFPLFAISYADQVDVEFATLMLTGSSERLLFGALIASMTAILFVPGIWLACQCILATHQKTRFWTYSLLLLSVVLMPLGHAVFFFTAEIHKAIYHTDVSAHPYLLETAAVFMRAHYITWGSAIIVLLGSWLVYSILIFTGRTTLKRWVGLASPVFITVYLVVAAKILPPSPVRGYLIAATFNVAYLLFFVVLLFQTRQKSTMNSPL